MNMNFSKKFYFMLICFIFLFNNQIVPALAKPLDNEPALTAEEILEKDRPELGAGFAGFMNANNNNHDEQLPQEDVSETSSVLTDWNTFTFCAIISAIIFVIVWVLFWIIFQSESMEFQEINHSRSKKSSKFLNYDSMDSDAKDLTGKTRKSGSTSSDSSPPCSIALKPLAKAKISEVIPNNGDCSLVKEEAQEVFVVIDEDGVLLEDNNDDEDVETNMLMNGNLDDNASNINLYTRSITTMESSENIFYNHDHHLHGSDSSEIVPSCEEEVIQDLV